MSYFFQSQLLPSIVIFLNYSMVEVSHSAGERLGAQLHIEVDAINQHFRYIYARMEDVVKRIEKLERNRQF